MIASPIQNPIRLPVDSRILLVDDDVMILQSLSSVLEDLGCHVATASGPDEALARISEDTFHVAFVDNFLGPIQGVELMQQMSRVRPDLRFVIMTANPNIDLAVEALKKGADDFVRKPFRIEDLLISIDHVNRKKELERQRQELLSELEQKVSEKTQELTETYLSVLASFSRAVEKKDLGTHGHSMRVSEYSKTIATALGLPTDEIQTIGDAALLHDIGKIGISDSLLAKTGDLDDLERAVIRSHATKGVEILQPLKQFVSLLPGILHHHESWDGRGYPGGLSGVRIPLAARIIAVADAYDAILSDRPYRPASTGESARSELIACAGKQFDPRVVAVFICAVNNREGCNILSGGGDL